MTTWLDRLSEYERQGFREVPGKDSNPVILKWAHGVGQADYMTDDSSTPWCGIGLAGIMEEVGLKHVIPKGPAAAINWLNCGVPCEPKPGAVAVFPRTGGNHVTVIKSIAGNTWHCIGCNQHNSICTAPFDGRTARGTRWPIKPKTAKELATESRIAAAAARQKRDQAVAGGTGATIPATPPPAAPAPVAAPPAPPEAIPAPLPDHWRQSVDNILGDFGWFQSAAGGVVDFAAFVGSHWWFVAAGIAAYFLLRSLWDSHRIALWRTQDHNEGYST
jgi:uncharacterized protein (TIGR02594 family)